MGALSPTQEDWIHVRCKGMNALKAFIRNAWSFSKRRPFVAGISAVVLFVVLSSIFGGGGGPAEYDIETVGRKTVVDLVDVTGKVKSPDKVDLGIERGGKIARIEAQVGDEVYAGEVLVVTNNSDLWARYEEAKANLELEKLNLQETSQTSDIEVETAFIDLVNAIQDAYASVGDAVQNKLSDIFKGSESTSVPKLGVITSSGAIIDFGLNHEEILEVSSIRLEIDKALSTWRNNPGSVTKSNILVEVSEAEDVLLNAQRLLDDITGIVNDYRAGSLSYQAEVDAERPNIFAARTLVVNALNDLRSAKQDYLSAIAELGVDEGYDLRTNQLQKQRVSAAQARVDAALAEINKSIITAPFSGVVTRVETEVGEIVASNSPIVSMISDAPFEIEAYVAEADISKVEIGSVAEVTLDAYGSTELFEAKVVFVDPAETILEGVSTYRVLLNFTDVDERIRSGMTANVEILSASKEDVIAVPQRAVFNKDGDDFVRVLIDKEPSGRQVVTGVRSFDGYVEIVSGLEEGEQVVVFVRD